MLSGLLTDGGGSVRRILLAEDEPSLRLVYAEALSDAGFDVRSVASGDECLRTIAYDAPSVLVLDLKMPGTLGADVVRHLRQNRQTSVLPVVIITGSVSINLFPAAEDVQAVLLKPFDVDLLIDTVKRVVV